MKLRIEIFETAGVWKIKVFMPGGVGSIVDYRDFGSKAVAEDHASHYTLEKPKKKKVA